MLTVACNGVAIKQGHCHGKGYLGRYIVVLNHSKE